MQVGDDKSFDDINVTPMVDLYLVLLLIFIIMTTAGVQGVKVKLPKASAAAVKKLDQPKMQAITVNSEGKCALNTIPVTLAEFESKLSTLKKETPIVIRGDSSTPFQNIMDALAVVNSLNFTEPVGVVAAPPK